MCRHECIERYLSDKHELYALYSVHINIKYSKWLLSIGWEENGDLFAVIYIGDKGDSHIWKEGVEREVRIKLIRIYLNGKMIYWQDRDFTVTKYIKERCVENNEYWNYFENNQTHFIVNNELVKLMNTQARQNF